MLVLIYTHSYTSKRWRLGIRFRKWPEFDNQKRNGRQVISSQITKDFVSARSALWFVLNRTVVRVGRRGRFDTSRPEFLNEFTCEYRGLRMQQEIKTPTETINAGSSTITLEPRTKNLLQCATKKIYKTVELKWRGSFS